MKARKAVELSEENVQWFQDTYSGNASLSWLLDMLMTKFREAHTQTPAELARLGAEELKRELMK